MYVEGDLPVLTTTGNGNGNSNGMGWGGDWAWWIVILLIFGWGNGGWNNGSNGNGGGGVMDAYVLSSDFSQLSDIVNSGFDRIGNRIENVNNGICNLGYQQAQLINGVQMQVANEFRGLDNSVCTLGYQTQAGFNSLGAQIADCCCKQTANIKDLQYAMATESCATRQAIADSTNAVIGFLTQEKISGLQAENAALSAQLSQSAQTQTIINALQPVAKPAYITCSPYQSAYGFGLNNGCGCNSCGC